ncbi:MAG: deoxycytidylate deaminase [Patescibacteria group bacterium]
MNSKAKKSSLILVSYVPVLHQGYLDFFIKNIKKNKITELWLISNQLAHELRALQKDIRAIDVNLTKDLIETLRLFKSVKILNQDNLKNLQSSQNALIFSDETLSHYLVEKYFPKNKVKFDSTFLMWDEKSSIKEIDLAKYKVKKNKKSILDVVVKANTEKTQSDDWWRHVGAVAFKGSKVLLAHHNQHVPTEYQTAYEGDPRANFHKGEYLKVSTAIHAEALLIADAAKQGISLDGAELLVTTFPCPVCAKQIAYSGVKKVYFIDGYSVLDGERILKDNNIKIEKIEL